MAYYIDAQWEEVQYVPCTVTPSRIAGKTLLVNADGSSVCVEPNGDHTRDIPAGDPNWDSPYTQGTQLGQHVVYQSANGDDPGTPRGFIVVQ